MSESNRLTKADLEAIRALHPFVRSLGEGPYRFVGMFSINLEAGRQGRPYVNPHEMHPRFVTGCGTCSHCGMAILNIYQVQVASGDVYGVGSDCINKLALPVRDLTDAERAKAKADKAKRAALKARKGAKARAELAETIQSDSERLSRLPHPSEWLAKSKGLTLLDYAAWNLERSNDGGIVIVQKRVAAILAQAIMPETQSQT